MTQSQVELELSCRTRAGFSVAALFYCLMTLLDFQEHLPSGLISRQQVSKLLNFSVADFEQYEEWLRRVKKMIPEVEPNKYPIHLAIMLGRFVKSAQWLDRVPSAPKR